jgi:hypothetical protein
MRRTGELLCTALELELADGAVVGSPERDIEHRRAALPSERHLR